MKKLTKQILLPLGIGLTSIGIIFGINIDNFFFILSIIGIIIIIITSIKIKNLRTNWTLGFLGFLSLLGIRYFQTGEWLYLVWFTWITWFYWFIPKNINKKIIKKFETNNLLLPIIIGLGVISVIFIINNVYNYNLVKNNNPSNKIEINYNYKNPSEEYCLSKGGKIETINRDNEEKKICFINNGIDGIRCDLDLFFNKECGYRNTTNSNQKLPIGYSLNSYKIEEKTDISCNYDSDCETPMEYLAQSRCPFTSICIENKCNIVCPNYDNNENNFTGEHPCNLEPNPGLCKGAFKKYYFDKQEGKCKEFLWGGCDGIVPFDSLDVCKSSCIK